MPQILFVFIEETLKVYLTPSWALPKTLKSFKRAILYANAGKATNQTNSQNFLVDALQVKSSSKLGDLLKLTNQSDTKSSESRNSKNKMHQRDSHCKTKSSFSRKEFWCPCLFYHPLHLGNEHTLIYAAKPKIKKYGKNNKIAIKPKT